MSPGRGKVKFMFILKDWIEKLVLTLTNVLHFLNSPSYLVNLGLLNNTKIYHHNKDQILYDHKIEKTLAFTEWYKTSFLLHFFKLSGVAMNLLKNSKAYKEKILNINQTKNNKLFRIRWHQRLGHLSFTLQKKHLFHENVTYIDDTEGYMCNSCKRPKATKQYNWTLERKVTMSYQYIHTIFMSPITPINFGKEWYLFMLTNNYTHITKTYIKKRKNKWFKCLKVFYNLAETWTKLDWWTKWLQLDYGFELQSWKLDKWLTNQRIVFEPPAP